MKNGTLVMYQGATAEQVNWGNNDDPRDLLQIGAYYTVLRAEQHSWHTKLQLKGFEDKRFNSVSFEEVP